MVFCWRRVCGIPNCYNIIRRSMSARPAQEFSKVVKVRNLEQEDNLKLMFEDCWNVSHELNRSKSEHLSVVLNRIQLTLLKVQRKRSREKVSEGSSVPPTSVEACLYNALGDRVPGDKPNSEAWMDYGKLTIGEHSYTVQVNPPRVLSMKLSDCLFSGCPVVPKVELDNAQVHRCNWTWYRLPKPITPLINSSPPPDDSPSVLKEAEVTVGTSFTYWPSEEDVGHQLTVECSPVNSMGKTGEPLSCTSLMVVSRSPENTPIHRRHLQTPWQLADVDKFRMVTYNTLAGVFTEEEYAKTVLYPYCDPGALDILYRQCQLMQELVGYNADVINLQEVTTSTFEKYMLPAFTDKGYDGILQLKGGTVSEGEATFFNTSKFKLVDKDTVVLADFFTTHPACESLLQGLRDAPFLPQVQRKKAIGLVCLLQSVECPSRYLLVANTHLYYHPRGDLIRLIQVETMLRYLKTRLDLYSSSLGSDATIGVVLAGDFNSCPCIAAYQYLVKGSVGKDHQDWMVYKSKEIPRCECFYKYNTVDVSKGQSERSLPPHMIEQMEHEEEARSSTDGPEDNFAGLDLQHTFNFINVGGTSNLTNYTSDFKAVLDYIFIDSGQLNVDRVISMPSVDEMSEFVALPSVYFPSDHVALVADLKWT